MNWKYDAIDYVFLSIILLCGISVASYSATVVIFGKSGLSNIVKPKHSIQVLQIVASSVLTLGLIVLYKQQKDILDEQTQLKRSELAGEIVVNEFEFEEEEAFVDLSNPSSSEITDIRIFTEVHPKEIAGRDLSEVKSKGMKRQGENSSEFGRSASLGPHEFGITFCEEVSVSYMMNESKMRSELGYFIYALKTGDTEIDQIRCRIWIEGKDQLGNKVSAKVLRWDRTIMFDRFSANQVPDLQDIFTRSVSAQIDDNKSEYDSN
jgi:hypothetical protein